MMTVNQIMEELRKRGNDLGKQNYISISKQFRKKEAVSKQKQKSRIIIILL